MPSVHRELRRKGVTLQLLWQEYCEANAGQPTYQYTQFCQRYHDYAASLRRSMRQVHRAGEKLSAPLTRGSVVASDAFFPFADGLLVAIEAGATAVIQPGGSVRDDEVIKAADDHGIAMVFTGTRHFRH